MRDQRSGQEGAESHGSKTFCLCMMDAAVGKSFEVMDLRLLHKHS